MTRFILSKMRRIVLLILLLGNFTGIVPGIFLSREALATNKTALFLTNLSPILLTIALLLGLIWILTMIIPLLRGYLKSRQILQDVPLAIQKSKYQVLANKPHLNPAVAQVEAEILQLGYDYMGSIENELGNTYLVFRDAEAETLLNLNVDDTSTVFRTRFEDGFFLQTQPLVPNLDNDQLLMSGILGDLQDMHNYHQQQIAKLEHSHGQIRQHPRLEDNLTYLSDFNEHYIQFESRRILHAMLRYILLLFAGFGLVLVGLAFILWSDLSVRMLVVIGMISFISAELLARIVPKVIKPIRLQKKRAT